jgi:hypothetical protein
MDQKELENRLRVLEDIEAIRKMKALYAEICDDRYDVKRMEKLFVEDSVWDGGEVWGVYKGRNQIMKFFAETGKSITGVHLFVQPTIRIISDREAEGSWYLLQQGTKGNMAFWLSAVEYEKYVKINGEWFFKEIKFKEFFATRFEEGWHRNKMCL